MTKMKVMILNFALWGMVIGDGDHIEARNRWQWIKMKMKNIHFQAISSLVLLFLLLLLLSGQVGATK